MKSTVILKEEGQVSIIHGVNQVLFNIDGILIATRIIEGEFPNYKQVIPKEGHNKAKVKTAGSFGSYPSGEFTFHPGFSGDQV